MDAIENLFDYKGYKIRLKAEEGIYEGIIKDVCLDPKKLLLCEVKAIEPKEFLFSDVQSFYSRDIISYDILCDSKDVLETKLGSKNCSKRPFKDRSHRSKTKNFIFDDLSDSESVCTQQDAECEEIPEIEDEEEFVLKLPEHLKRRLPIDHVIIDEICKTFHQAINHISNECTIGVSFEGTNIGRHGKLYWIGISTRICTFLFDISSLKETAFTSGLKDIMQSVGILKVIHDSRQPSDCLQHQYNTCLRNVFDTQVADAFVSMQCTGQISNKVHSLHMCAQSYLNLDSKDIYVSMETRTAVSLPEWEYKPLRNRLRDRMIKNVIYLRLLRDEIVEHLLKPLYSASDAFLNVVRNSSEKELKLLKPSVPHLMPESLLTAGLQIVHVKSFAKSNGYAKNALCNTFSQKMSPLEQCIEVAGRFNSSSKTKNIQDARQMKITDNELLKTRVQEDSKKSKKTSRMSCPPTIEGTATHSKKSTSDERRTRRKSMTNSCVNHKMSGSEESENDSDTSDLLSLSSSFYSVKTTLSPEAVATSDEASASKSSVKSTSESSSSVSNNVRRDFSQFKMIPAGMEM